MQSKDFKKELLRYSFSICLLIFTIYVFRTTFINQENTEKFTKNLSEDFDRFLNLNLNNNYSIEVIIFIYAFLLVSFISASYWYNNPHLYEENNLQVYSKIFALTALFIVFFFYFLRINNVSRFYFLIYILIVPILFLFLRSNGIFSKYLIRQINENKFIHLKDTKSYKDEIYVYKQFKKSGEVHTFNLENLSESDIFRSVGELQKSKQFDFILINVSEYNSFIKNVLYDLSILKKPIFLAIKSKNQLIETDLAIKKIESSYFNLYFINLKVQDGLGILFKRIIDILASVLIIFLTLPLWIFTMVFIYLQDFHSPIISIKRSGLYGREFKMYKFRTMRVDSHKLREDLEELNARKGPLFKIDNDPRIIKNLSWVRKSSIDELPQLINVLKGEMSLVGPRPLFSEDLAKFETLQTTRLCVLPGITGMLQINERETQDFERWFYWDKKYIETWSLWLDLKILIKTPLKIRNSI